MEHIFSVIYGTLKCLKSLYKIFLASQIMKEKIAKSLGQIHPSGNRFKFLIQITTFRKKAI